MPLSVNAARDMRRVLLVAYDFPPQPNAAAVRLGALARRLPDFGWAPTVITRPAGAPPPPECRVVFTPKHGVVDAPRPYVPPAQRARHVPLPLRSIVRSIRSLANFPDPSRSWVPLVLRAAEEALRESKHHALITSHGPSAEHLAGAEIVRRHRLPWLADYRDLWSAQPWAGRSQLLATIERRMETRALKSASAVTTVAPRLQAALQQLLGRRDVDVLTNIVDDEAWQGIADDPPRAFSFLYAGRLHYGRRDPRILFEAIARLRAKDHPAGMHASFVYYGREGETIRPAADAAGLSARDVSVNGIADRRDILSAERAAAVLVVLMNMEERAEFAEGVPSKVYEYAGARRPLLAIGPRGSAVQAYIEASGLGYYASDVLECEAALEKLWQAFTAGAYRPNPKPAWRPFGASDLAAGVAQILDRVSAQGLKETTSNGFE